ncbi:hypothetical protein LINPERHAP1_LOCUS13992 [Linum perenne]
MAKLPPHAPSLLLRLPSPYHSLHPIHPSKPPPFPLSHPPALLPTRRTSRHPSSASTPVPLLLRWSRLCLTYHRGINR